MEKKPRPRRVRKIDMPIDYIKPVIDKRVRELCYKPYTNHPKGCPNYGKRETCPPKAVLLPDYFDISKPIMVVWADFNLGQHREKMMLKHPNWSRRQLDCCLYWQGKVTKRLKQEVKYNLGRSDLFQNLKNLAATYCPEAMGVNVTETMKNVGLILEWPPVKIVRKIAFIGSPPAAKES